MQHSVQFPGQWSADPRLPLQSSLLAALQQWHSAFSLLPGRLAACFADAAESAVPHLLQRKQPSVLWQKQQLPARAQ